MFEMANNYPIQLLRRKKAIFQGNNIGEYSTKQQKSFQNKALNCLYNYRSCVNFLNA